MAEVLSGVYPHSGHAFDMAGHIDLETLRREVEFMVEAGVHGVGIALASEVPTLSETERDLALSTVVDQARRRVSVVMNTGAAGTDLAVLYSRRAEDLGADAVIPYKEVLRLRGVFANTEVRRPASRPDEIAYRELRHQVEVRGLDGARHEPTRTDAP